MPAPTILNTKTSTSIKYGGDALNNVNNFLNGVNVTSVIGTPIIRTPTKIPSDILKFTDPAEDNTVTIKIPALSADKNINLVPSDVQDNDEVLYKDTVQIVTGKVLSAASNTITNLDTSNLAASADIITTTNTKTMINKTLTAPVIATITNNASTLTLPTSTTTMVGRDTIDTVINKTYDQKNNIFLRLSRIGLYSPASRKGGFSNATGVLSGLVGVGSQGTTNLNTGGKYHIWNTWGTANNDVAGVLKLDTFTTWRIVNPLTRFAFLFTPNTSSNRRMFKGYVGNQRMVNTNSDTLPTNSTEPCFLFGHGAGDTSFSIFYNDASGTCNKAATGINLPAIATNYILEIEAVDATPSFIWTLYSVGTPGVRSAILGSQTLGQRTYTSDIPSQTTGLYIQDLVVATDTSVQPNNIHYIEVFTS